MYKHSKVYLPYTFLLPQQHANIPQSLLCYVQPELCSADSDFTTVLLEAPGNI